MKQDLLIIPIIIIIIITIFGSYKLIELSSYNSRISSLERYTYKQDEKNIKKINYNKKEYIITNYLPKEQTYTNLNILFKNKEKYYLLKEIEKCDADTNTTYTKDNEIYIHCIGKEGNINKYTINEFEITEELLVLSYDNVPKLSELHVIVEKIDNHDIYIKSLDTKAKCTINQYKYICEYHN